MLSPPLIITEEQVMELVKLFDESVQELEKELEEKGLI